ncbi:hypothetical protein [Corallococcus exercitus]|uniref:DUF4156 domain-containing protein n=1 Tax=Corallococcus exercitus TaxID=2316736 RepID=A0A7Y4KNW5_9BACT|nr:hypothetical protein [Corallococcus exercitus]NOK37077.1 hypothetical protein [Corallococcus exercitus]
MRIAVGLLACGLMLGCGGAESDVTMDDGARTDAERTVTASADLQHARFEVKATSAVSSPCSPSQLEAAEAHMVKNFGPYTRLVDCTYYFFGQVGFIDYTYTLTR